MKTIPTPYHSFSKVQCARLRDQLNEVLSEYGAETNLEFKLGRITFNSAEVSVKLEAKVRGTETIEDRQLKREMAFHGLNKNGKNGEVLTGYNSRRYKYPFSYTDGNGRRMKAQLTYAKILFG